MNAHGTLSPHANDVATGAWRMDPKRSSVEFHAPRFWGLATVKGHFESYQGTLDLGANRAIELTIDATSLETGIRRRDQHLRSAEFFDAERHPYVRFVSDPAALDGNTLKVTRRLHVRGSEDPARDRRADRPGRRRAGDRGDHQRGAPRPCMTWNRLGIIRGDLQQMGPPTLARPALSVTGHTFLRRVRS